VAERGLMARSSYIYVIQYRGHAAPPVACFTVKHEAISWAKRDSPVFFDRYVLFRYRDNPRVLRGEISQPEFIPWPSE
jgi:hypothetical protein